MRTETANSSGNGIAQTIDGHYFLGCGARGGVEREVVAIAYYDDDIPEDTERTERE